MLPDSHVKSREYHVCASFVLVYRTLSRTRFELSGKGSKFYGWDSSEDDKNSVWAVNTIRKPLLHTLLPTNACFLSYHFLLKPLSMSITVARLRRCTMIWHILL